MPVRNERLVEMIVWTINQAGEPCMYEAWYHRDAYYLPDILLDGLNFLGDGGLLSGLPLPFEPGNIVTIDCRPYMDVFHAVISDIGDNEDCCAVQAIFVGQNGLLDITAMKHNTFTSGSPSYPSCLYRAEKYTDQLPRRERPLLTISRAIRENPECGISFGDRINNSNFAPLKSISHLDKSITGKDQESIMHTCGAWISMHLAEQA